MQGSRNAGGSNAGKWIEHQVPWVGQGENQPFNQANRKLAWVVGLLDMVAFYVGDVPHVLGVLAQRIAGVVASVGPLEVAFPRILRGHAHIVKIENIGLVLRSRFGVPHNHFVAAGKAAFVVQAMAELPDDPIAQA